MRRLWEWIMRLKRPAFPNPRPWTWAELQRMKVSDRLGGDVIIPVSGPAEVLSIYRERQAAIRRRSRG